MDCSANHDGARRVPCKRVVGHKHSVSLVEGFFVGDYPSSKAMIPQEASWTAILLQAVFFFLPGSSRLTCVCMCVCVCACMCGVA